jgi:hypothetical protein
MSKLRGITAPSQGRVVRFDAVHLRPGARSLVVPAIIHNVVRRDEVTLWAVDDDGEPLLGADGGLPVARFGELVAGSPAPACWCWPTMSNATVDVANGEAAEAATQPLRPERPERDFDPEETLPP